MKNSSACLAVGLAPATISSRPAGDTLRVGIIGCGGRGGWAFSNLAKLKASHNVAVVAVCDVWRPQRDGMAQRAEKEFGRKPQSFSDYRKVLDQRDVDAVVITTPDFCHSPQLTDAVNAGKDVYCEKPMATRIEHANAALDAVRANKRVVQIGTQRRSQARYATAAEMIQSGKLGKIVEIDTGWNDNKARWTRDCSNVHADDVDWDSFLRHAPKRDFDPRRVRCWQLYRDYTVGPIGLLGSHLIDVGTWFAGDPYPRSAVALGGTYLWKPREQADMIECAWEFPSGFVMRYSTRLGNNLRRPEVIVYGTKGTFDTASWRAVPDGGGKGRLQRAFEIERAPAENHVANWLDCVHSRKDPNASIEHGHAHSVATIMAYRAWLTGRRMVWNGDTRTIEAG